jgi:hypothetical protein
MSCRHLLLRDWAAHNVHLTSMKLSKLSKLTFTGALALSLLPAAAMAEGKGHGKGNGKNHAKQHDRDDDRGHDRDRDNDRDHDRDGDHDRDDHGNHVADSSRPAGWSKGKKTGWGDCDVPPGQVKKYGCHPNSSLSERALREREEDRRRSAAARRYPTGTRAGVLTPIHPIRDSRTAQQIQDARDRARAARDRAERDAQRARETVTPR